MVVLRAFLAITVFGIGVWAVGTAIRRPDVAAIGSIVVIGIGGSAILGEGILVEAGASQVVQNNTTIINTTYEPLETAASFPFDIVVLFLGSIMLFQSLGEASEQ